MLNQIPEQFSDQKYEQENPGGKAESGEDDSEGRDGVLHPHRLELGGFPTIHRRLRNPGSDDSIQLTRLLHLSEKGDIRLCCQRDLHQPDVVVDYSVNLHFWIPRESNHVGGDIKGNLEL